MRVIFHVDMDAFYASIEQRDNPALKGKPVIIGSAPDKRGVVSAASYEARAYGVHSAMPSRTAGQRCPNGVFLPVRMAHYIRVSEQLRQIFEQFTPFVEPLSVDEAFLDMTGVLHLWENVETLVRAMKGRIRAQLDLPCSVGVAPNKFLAKLASDLKKPDGLCVVPFEPDAIRSFLAPLPVRRVWGVGKVAGKQLNEHQIFTIGDLQKSSLPALQRIMGSQAGGAHMWALAHGIDDRLVETDSEDKSISREYTFGENCDDADVLKQVLLELTEQVGARLRKSGRYAQCVSIKFRFSDFRTHTRQESLHRPISSDRDLLRNALALLEAQHITQPIRLIGFGVSRFTAQSEPVIAQPDLFGEADRDTKQRRRNEQLDRAVDTLRKQYGRTAIKRGNWTLTEGTDS